MVEGAGNIIGGGWRCCVQADIVSQNATQAVIGVHIIYRRTDPSRWVVQHSKLPAPCNHPREDGIQEI